MSDIPGSNTLNHALRGLFAVGPGTELCELLALLGLSPDVEHQISADATSTGELTRLRPGDHFVDFGRDAARGRRLVAALAAGALVVVKGPFPLAESLAKSGAAVTVIEACPAALEAALYRGERKTSPQVGALDAEIALGSAWLETLDPTGTRPLATPDEVADPQAILWAFGIDAEDDRIRGDLATALDRYSSAIVAHGRTPRDRGESELEGLWMEREYRLLNREHTGPGRRLDLLSRENHSQRHRP